MRILIPIKDLVAAALKDDVSEYLGVHTLTGGSLAPPPEKRGNHELRRFLAKSPKFDRRSKRGRLVQEKSEGDSIEVPYDYTNSEDNLSRQFSTTECRMS